MAMMDTVRRLMAGRSEVVERSIDKAVGYLGRSSDTLKRQAEAAKAKARALDPDHPEGAAAGSPGTAAAPATGDRLPAGPVVPPPPVSPPPISPPPISPSTPSEPPSGSALRGDLVDPTEEAPPA